VKESKLDRKRLKEILFSNPHSREGSARKGNFEALHKLAKDGDTDHHLIN